MPASREPIKVDEIEHVIVYRRDDEYAGWPFNGGLWNFGGGELLVGFNLNKCSYRDLSDVSHDNIQMDDCKHVTLRSKDGGKTWLTKEMQTITESKAKLRMKLNWHNLDTFPKPKPIDFSDPNTALATETVLGNERGPSAYFLTRNKGDVWEGPFVLYDPVFQTVNSRPSYVLRQDGLLLLFTDCGKWRNLRGRVYSEEEENCPPVICATDNGVDWRFLSCISIEHDYIYGIWGGMASPAILPNRNVVAAIRRGWPTLPFHWTEIYCSEEGGLTWHFLSRVSDWGAPGHLLVLKDERLMCTYGRRVSPYGIRAKISDDGGRIWGPEIIVRDDGGSWDLGYPRTALLPDGKVIAVYYFNEAKDITQCDGGVRHIAASIFEVPY